MSAVTQLLGGASGQTASSFEGVAGGDAVRVTMNGERRVTTIVISPEVLDGADAALLEDMILAAFNDAFEQVSASKSELLGGLAQLLSPR